MTKRECSVLSSSTENRQLSPVKLAMQKSIQLLTKRPCSTPSKPLVCCHASKGRVLAKDLGEGADAREAKDAEATSRKRRLATRDSESSNNSDELAAGPLQDANNPATIKRSREGSTRLWMQMKHWPMQAQPQQVQVAMPARPPPQRCSTILQAKLRKVLCKLA